MPLAGYTLFDARPTKFLKLVEIRGCKLKVYSIVHPSTGALLAPSFEAGMPFALSDVPAPDPVNGCPGLGFVVMHQGLTADYIITCWWDLQDELPTRTFVRSESQWRRAVRESFCVWDLEVMWFERCAYVATILGQSYIPESEYLRLYAGAGGDARMLAGSSALPQRCG